MTDIRVYDCDAEMINQIAEDKGVTVASVIEAMCQCYSENNGECYL